MGVVEIRPKRVGLSLGLSRRAAMMPAPVSDEHAVSAEGRPTLLYLGIVAFDSVRQRPQWLASGLSGAWNVLYVDPHTSVLRAGSPRRKVVEHGPGLTVLVPPRALPVTGYVRPLNHWSSSRTAVAIRDTLAQLGWPLPAATIASFPKHVDLLSRLPRTPVIYDVMDDYPRFFGGLQARVLRDMHEELLRAANAVVTSSAELARRCTIAGARRVEVIENGVAAEFFAACGDASPDPAVASLPRPRFGYVGVVREWFDFGAIERLAVAYPGGSVVIVGPVDARPRRGLPANVHLLGRRPHAALPGLLRAFDLGIVPFTGGHLTDAVNPVKIYEYLAAGLPVLSTEGTEIRRFGPRVTVARAHAWPEAAAQLLERPPAADEQRRYVSSATWDQRVEALSRLMASTLRTHTT